MKKCTLFFFLIAVSFNIVSSYEYDDYSDDDSSNVLTKAANIGLDTSQQERHDLETFSDDGSDSDGGRSSFVDPSVRFTLNGNGYTITDEDLMKYSRFETEEFVEQECAKSKRIVCELLEAKGLSNRKRSQFFEDIKTFFEKYKQRDAIDFYVDSYQVLNHLTIKYPQIQSDTVLRGYIDGYIYNLELKIRRKRLQDKLYHLTSFDVKNVKEKLLKLLSDAGMPRAQASEMLRDMKKECDKTDPLRDWSILDEIRKRYKHVDVIKSNIFGQHLLFYTVLLEVRRDKMRSVQTVIAPEEQAPVQWRDVDSSVQELPSHREKLRFKKKNDTAMTRYRP